jgi:hypothetical protein
VCAQKFFEKKFAKMLASSKNGSIFAPLKTKNWSLSSIE